MQWDDGRHAGFSDAGASPWLPLADDAAVRNVALQRVDPDSILTLHRDLLALRRAEPALTAGAYRTVAVDGDVLAYLRGDRVLVALNLGEAPGELRLPGMSATVALGSARGRAGQRLVGGAVLAGGEAIVARLD
jgi:alpha-glucosidase